MSEQDSTPTWPPPWHRGRRITRILLPSDPEEKQRRAKPPPTDSESTLPHPPPAAATSSAAAPLTATPHSQTSSQSQPEPHPMGPSTWGGSYNPRVRQLLQSPFHVYTAAARRAREAGEEKAPDPEARWVRKLARVGLKSNLESCKNIIINPEDLDRPEEPSYSAAGVRALEAIGWMPQRPPGPIFGPPQTAPAEPKPTSAKFQFQFRKNRPPPPPPLAGTPLPKLSTPVQPRPAPSTAGDSTSQPQHVDSSGPVTKIPARFSPKAVAKAGKALKSRIDQYGKSYECMRARIRGVIESHRRQKEEDRLQELRAQAKRDVARRQSELNEKVLSSYMKECAEHEREANELVALVQKHKEKSPLASSSRSDTSPHSGRELTESSFASGATELDTDMGTEEEAHTTAPAPSAPAPPTTAPTTQVIEIDSDSVADGEDEEQENESDVDEESTGVSDSDTDVEMNDVEEVEVSSQPQLGSDQNVAQLTARTSSGTSREESVEIADESSSGDGSASSDDKQELSDNEADAPVPEPFYYPLGEGDYIEEATDKDESDLETRYPWERLTPQPQLPNGAHQLDSSMGSTVFIPSSTASLTQHAENTITPLNTSVDNAVADAAANAQAVLDSKAEDNDLNAEVPEETSGEPEVSDDQLEAVRNGPWTLQELGVYVSERQLFNRNNVPIATVLEDNTLEAHSDHMLLGRLSADHSVWHPLVARWSRRWTSFELEKQTRPEHRPSEPRPAPRTPLARLTKAISGFFGRASQNQPGAGEQTRTEDEWNGEEEDEPLAEEDEPLVEEGPQPAIDLTASDEPVHHDGHTVSFVPAHALQDDTPTQPRSQRSAFSFNTTEFTPGVPPTPSELTNQEISRRLQSDGSGALRVTVSESSVNDGEATSSTSRTGFLPRLRLKFNRDVQRAAEIAAELNAGRRPTENESEPDNEAGESADDKVSQGWFAWHWGLHRAKQPKQMSHTKLPSQPSYPDLTAMQPRVDDEEIAFAHELDSAPAQAVPSTSAEDADVAMGDLSCGPVAPESVDEHHPPPPKVNTTFNNENLASPTVERSAVTTGEAPGDDREDTDNESDEFSSVQGDPMGEPDEQSDDGDYSDAASSPWRPKTDECFDSSFAEDLGFCLDKDFGLDHDHSSYDGSIYQPDSVYDHSSAHPDLSDDDEYMESEELAVEDDDGELEVEVQHAVHDRFTAQHHTPADELQSPDVGSDTGMPALSGARVKAVYGVNLVGMREPLGPIEDNFFPLPPVPADSPLRARRPRLSLVQQALRSWYPDVYKSESDNQPNPEVQPASPTLAKGPASASHVANSSAHDDGPASEGPEPDDMEDIESPTEVDSQVGDDVMLVAAEEEEFSVMETQDNVDPIMPQEDVELSEHQDDELPSTEDASLEPVIQLQTAAQDDMVGSSTPGLSSRKQVLQSESEPQTPSNSPSAQQILAEVAASRMSRVPAPQFSSDENEAPAPGPSKKRKRRNPKRSRKAKKKTKESSTSADEVAHEEEAAHEEEEQEPAAKKPKREHTPDDEVVMHEDAEAEQAEAVEETVEQNELTEQIDPQQAEVEQIDEVEEAEVNEAEVNEAEVETEQIKLVEQPESGSAEAEPEQIEQEQLGASDVHRPETADFAEPTVHDELSDVKAPSKPDNKGFDVDEDSKTDLAASDVHEEVVEATGSQVPADLDDLDRPLAETDLQGQSRGHSADGQDAPIAQMASPEPDSAAEPIPGPTPEPAVKQETEVEESVPDVPEHKPVSASTEPQPVQRRTRSGATPAARAKASTRRPRPKKGKQAEPPVEDEPVVEKAPQSETDPTIEIEQETQTEAVLELESQLPNSQPKTKRGRGKKTKTAEPRTEVPRTTRTRAAAAKARSTQEPEEAPISTDENRPLSDTEGEAVTEDAPKQSSKRKRPAEKGRREPSAQDDKSEDEPGPPKKRGKRAPAKKPTRRSTRQTSAVSEISNSAPEPTPEEPPAEPAPAPARGTTKRKRGSAANPLPKRARNTRSTRTASPEAYRDGAEADAPEPVEYPASKAQDAMELETAPQESANTEAEAPIENNTPNKMNESETLEDVPEHEPEIKLEPRAETSDDRLLGLAEHLGAPASVVTTTTGRRGRGRGSGRRGTPIASTASVSGSDGGGPHRSTRVLRSQSQSVEPDAAAAAAPAQTPQKPTRRGAKKTEATLTPVAEASAVKPKPARGRGRGRKN